MQVDIFGLFKLLSLGGSQYLISFVDDFLIKFGGFFLLEKTKHLINSRFFNVDGNMHPKRKL
jgi:hypothetical protein